jgi:hypothetical protein
LKNQGQLVGFVKVPVLPQVGGELDVNLIVAGLTVRADFDGGAMSSDIGPLILRGVDRQIGLTASASPRPSATSAIRPTSPTPCVT